MRRLVLFVLFIYRMVTQRFFEQVTFKQRPRGRQGVNLRNIREKSIQGRRNSKCKGAESEACSVSSRNS